MGSNASRMSRFGIFGSLVVVVEAARNELDGLFVKARFGLDATLGIG